MRARMLLGWMVVALICVVGCENTRQQIKPPIPLQEVKDPPANDSRYSEPPHYPKGTLNQNKGMSREMMDENGSPHGMGPVTGPGGAGGFGGR